MSNKERIAAKKAQIDSNREALKALKNILNKMTAEFSLDEDRMAKRIDAALRSEYGAINGMINLIAAVASWPAEQGDGSMVSTNRQILDEKFDLDLMMLEDIRKFKGYHSFVADSDEIEIIDGVIPDYENYTDYCEIFLETLEVSANRPTICSDTWNRLEAKAKVNAAIDMELMKEELEKHKEFIAQQEGQ